MKRLVSGITPSGDGSLHIGNYIGAVQQFITLAKEYECFLFVADLHALTTILNKDQFRKNVETLILNELSLLYGFLPEKDFNRLTFYRQSDIGLHPELQTILNNVTPLGLLKRAHAYKDKLTNQVAGEDDINFGLFSYPVLMAADILMYQPDIVPVGKDQKQHIEITRDIAEKFNTTYGEIFKLPEAFIPEETATVIGTDGKRKMSKSLGNIIGIFEPEEVIRKQVMGTYTDPTRKHATDPGHIEGNMVFAYLDYFGEKGKVEEYKTRYSKGTVGDVEVKEYLYSSLMEYFRPARERFKHLQDHPDLVRGILSDGAKRAREIAQGTMETVRKAVGLKTTFSI